MKSPLLLAMAAFGLLFLADTSEAAAQQSGRARVLVVPLQTGAGVSSNFGKKVADEVRKNIGDFPTMASIEEKEVKAELKRLKLNEQELGAIQWRQLAGRMNAQVVMFGTVARNGTGNAVNVAFIDAKTGDELAVPEFVVAGDGNSEVKESAATILTAFERHVDYQQSVLFCSDYLQAEQYEDALRNCEKALAMNPASKSALLYRGSIYVGMEEWEKALPDLETVVEANPAETSALQLLAYTHAHLDNMVRATELYREYLNFNPNDAEVRLSVAYNLASAGGHEAAIALLQEGIALDDTNADLWKFLGDIALNKGTAAGNGDGTAPPEGGVSDEAAVRLAVDAYEKVLEIRGEDVGAEILQNVVAAYLAIGDYDAALQFAERALAMVPDNAALWSSKADVLGRQERFALAVESLDRVLEIDPAYPNAVLRRGLFRLRGGDTEAAKEDFRAAVASGSDPNIIAQQLLARGHRDHFQKKEYDAAISMFMAGTEFATDASVLDQLYFFSAYGYYQQGVGIDKANQQAEACGPARRALAKFQQVEPNLQKAGDVQRNNQAQIRESADVYVYRQQQIIRKSC